MIITCSIAVYLLSEVLLGAFCSISSLEMQKSIFLSPLNCNCHEWFENAVHILVSVDQFCTCMRFGQGMSASADAGQS
jgi:hypothetical protein